MSSRRKAAVVTNRVEPAGSTSSTPHSFFPEFNKTPRYFNPKSSVQKFLNGVVEREAHQVYSVQKVFGVTKENPHGIAAITTFFHIAAALGNELFFITFLPILHWIFSFECGFLTIQIWGLTYYVGQFLKDYLCLPRPNAKIVVRVDSQYNQEYGFPSTHVMGAIAIPFYIYTYCLSRGIISSSSSDHHFDYTPLLYLTIPIIWLSSIAASRLYLGVHSPVDMYAGAVLGFSLLYYFAGCGGESLMLEWLENKEFWNTWVLVPVAVFFLSIYPAPKSWSPSYGDTATILGVVVGVSLGHKIIYDTELTVNALMDVNTLVGTQFILACIKRICVGALLVGLTREISKAISMAIFTAIMPKNSEVIPKRRYEIEIPAKFTIYSCVGFSAVFLSAYAFDYLGI